MGESGKVIKGPIHGFIKLSPLQEELLAQPELQRLAWVKQLGLVLTVYPGGHQTRLEHSLGTSYLCGKISDHLSLEEEEKRSLEAAGMLHDLGHAPFSHAIEPIMPQDHMELTRDLILGEAEKFGKEGVSSVLEEYGVSPRKVADLVMGDFGGDGYLQDIISSQMDADQLDYLARDSHYTGVSYGAIELDWLLNVMRMNEGRLTYLEKGVGAIEQFLLAREQMYSSVYRHKTVDIAEEMLLRAVERYSQNSDISELILLTDGELLERLKGSNPFSREMVKRIENRNLYKQAWVIRTTDSESVRSKLEHIRDKERDEIEGEIAEEVGMDEDELIVDKQEGVLLEVEPRLRKFNIKITKSNGDVVPLEEVSGITRALKEKQPLRNLFSVYTTPEHREEVRKAAEDRL